MHWVFVCVCDLDVNRADSSSCLLQTFDASSSCPEITKPLLSVSAWRIFEQKKEMYKYFCTCVMNIYAFLFCAIK